jgi:L-fuconolactonase
MPEAIIEPDLPIIDPHHHLWDRRPVMHLIPPPVHPFEHISYRKGHYLLDQLLEDTGSGHNIAATVYLECRSMYRADGPAEMKCVGETEFVNGVAAMAASGLYGKTLACAGIVSTAELLLGADVGRVLDAHMRRAARVSRAFGVRPHMTPIRMCWDL